MQKFVESFLQVLPGLIATQKDDLRNSATSWGSLRIHIAEGMFCYIHLQCSKDYTKKEVWEVKLPVQLSKKC